MNRLFTLLVVAGFALTVSATDQSTDAKDIQGTWVPTKAEMSGQPMTDDFLKNTTLKMDDGKYLVTVSGSPDNGTYTLDPAAAPKTLDITGTEGPNTGKKILAIYELRGDKLRICYGLGGSARPIEFESPKGSKVFLVSYERKKSK